MILDIHNFKFSFRCIPKTARYDIINCAFIAFYFTHFCIRKLFTYMYSEYGITISGHVTIGDVIVWNESRAYHLLCYKIVVCLA